MKHSQDTWERVARAACNGCTTEVSEKTLRQRIKDSIKSELSRSSASKKEIDKVFKILLEYRVIETVSEKIEIGAWRKPAKVYTVNPGKLKGSTKKEVIARIGTIPGSGASGILGKLGITKVAIFGETLEVWDIPVVDYKSLYFDVLDHLGPLETFEILTNKKDA